MGFSISHQFSETAHRLTGRTRVRFARERLGWFKSNEVLIVQVEESYIWRSIFSESGGTPTVRWRDLKPADLLLPAQCAASLSEVPPPDKDHPP